MEPESSEEHPSGPPPSKRHRKKVNGEWSDESVLKLIAAVEPHEILWNPALKDYRNRGLRDTIWKSISEDTLEGLTTMEELPNGAIYAYNLNRMKQKRKNQNPVKVL